jgi:transposase InsO family protein
MSMSTSSIWLKYPGKLKSVPGFAFVATQRVTRFAHVEILPDRAAATVAAAMQRFLTAFAYPVHTALTDNGSEFTDRFADGPKAGHAARSTKDHPFDRVCAAAGIRHRTTRPYTPRTNGMVERFNRSLAEALRALPKIRDNARHRTHFLSQADRQEFLLRFVSDYNRTRLRCLDYKAPLEVLSNLTEHNTEGGAHQRRA